MYNKTENTKRHAPESKKTCHQIFVYHFLLISIDFQTDCLRFFHENVQVKQFGKIYQYSAKLFRLNSVVLSDSRLSGTAYFWCLPACLAACPCVCLSAASSSRHRADVWDIYTSDMNRIARINYSQVFYPDSSNKTACVRDAPGGYRPITNHRRTAEQHLLLLYRVMHFVIIAHIKTHQQPAEELGLSDSNRFSRANRTQAYFGSIHQRPRLLLITNRKSNTGFQMTLKSMTLDDLWCANRAVLGLHGKSQ